MTLMARPLIGALDEITLWVGIFGVVDPALPTFAVDGSPVAALGASRFFAIRDRQVTAGKPINHQGVFRLPATAANKLHNVVVTCNGQTDAVQVLSLPSTVTDDGFTILLSSCYSQPADPDFLTTIIRDLRPDITLLAGDQGYMDLPLLEDIPETQPAMSQMLGNKVRKHWLAEKLGIRGLYPLFNAAPTACIPDDHEYWNNYPFAQAQLPGTHTSGGRSLWGAAARALYEDYQQGGDPAGHKGWQTINIDPLHLLLLDTRSDRLPDLKARFGLMSEGTEGALVKWADGLMNAHGRGETAIGILATGQSLLAEAASAPEIGDAEYPNFDRQYRTILSELNRLVSAGIPVVCLTGDVHWSRVTRVHHFPSNSDRLTEVICSPSSLFGFLGFDQVSSTTNFIKSLIFGKTDNWLRFPNPADPPGQLLQGPFKPNVAGARGFKGNMVSLLRFTRAGSGLDMTVTYYPLHDDPQIKRPQPAGTIKLIPNG